MNRTSTYRRDRGLRLVGVAGILAGAVAFAAGPAPVLAASSVSGTVFQDFDSDGELDATVVSGQATDIGVAGVTVTAYDASGSPVGTTTSTADGTYTLSVTSDPGDPLRIEFESPVTGPLASLRPSFMGSGNGTTVQFVTASATSVNAAFNVPGEYCQANPSLSVSRLCAGTGSALAAAPTVFVTDYEGGPYDTTTDLIDGFTSWNSNNAGTKADTGSILGMAWDPTTRRIYNTAYVRRHADMYESDGSARPGALFVTTPQQDGTGGGTQFLVDLEDLMAGDQFSSSTSAQPGFIPTNAARQIECMVDATTANGCVDDDGVDSDKVAGRVGVYEEVGQTGIGDIEVDDQGNLYVVSLYDKNLYKVTMPTGGAPTTMVSLGNIASGMTCTSGEARPFSVRLWRGALYLGVVCDASSEFDEATPLAVYNTNLTFTIRTRSLDLQGAFSTFFGPHPLNSTGNITKGITANGVTYATSLTWNAWTNYFPPKASTSATAQFHNRPQPLLSEIEFDRDGSMILGFRDRTGDQSSTNLSETPTGGSTQYPTIASGDVYRVCRTGPGYAASDYVFEGGTGCTQSSTPTDNGTEYYFGDAYLYPPNWLVGHGEISAGMLAQVPGFPDVVFTGFDPFNGPSNGRTVFYSGGIRYLRNDSGKPYGAGADLGVFPNAGGGVMMYSHTGQPLSVGGFQKVNGMSDVEALCDGAPVQIGNRVWIDTDKDGIQDPDETPVAGVTVRLYAADGTTLLGTAITDADGEYYFSSNLTEAAEGTGDHLGGGLVVGNVHVVRFDEPSDYQTGGPLDGYELTSDNQGAKRTVDSDATLVADFPQISVPARAAGENDHTFDVGFVLASGQPPTPPSPTPTPVVVPPGTVSVGNFVWFDADNDGVQDAGERPIVGATMSITDMNGRPVTDVRGRPVAPQTTGSDGRYLFTDLPPGQYQVTITYPDGNGPTRPIEGSDRDGDSSTNVAVSRMLAAGESDLTLDFGVIPVVSVGDYVWWDTNRDGRQDSTDVPLSGVVLTITTIDGQPVFDSQGRPVTTTTTDAKGWYTFDDLPLGHYKVTVTPPDGYRATLAGVGSVEGDSSTGFAVSRDLQVGGDRDPTLDFGFVATDLRLPRTGGGSAEMPWIAMLFVLGGFALIVVGRRLRHRLDRLHLHPHPH